MVKFLISFVRCIFLMMKEGQKGVFIKFFLNFLIISLLLSLSLLVCLAESRVRKLSFRNGGLSIGEPVSQTIENGL